MISTRRSARLRRTRRNPNYHLVRGLLVALLCGGLAFIAVRAYDGVPLKPYGQVAAEVPDVGNLREHDQVRLAGVRIGQVSGLSATPDGKARIDIQLEPSAPDLPIDSAVAIRSAGLLGARSVEVLPGRSKEMAGDDAVLRGGRFAKTFGVSEALEVFDDETRGGLGQIIDGFSVGLLGNGRRLNDALRVGAAAQRPFERIMDDVLEQPEAVDRFTPSVAQMMTALNASRAEIAGMLTPTAAALRPFSQERRALQRTLDVAPDALRRTGEGLTTGRALLAQVRTLSRAVTGTLEPAPSALRATTALLRESPRPLDRTADLLEDVGPAVPATLKVLRSTRPVLRPVADAVTDLVPLARRVGEYGCDIVNFGAVFRSMTGVAVPGKDGPAGYFRLYAAPSPLESAGLNAEGSATTNYDPFPEPCKFTGPRSTQSFLGGPAPTAQRRTGR